jgi:hypothetical protein
MPNEKGMEHHFRNLRNSWYHEFSLNYPHESREERLICAAWKIIQCYYTVFASIASLGTFVKPKRKSNGGHEKLLNVFVSEFLCNKERKDYFLPPLNFYLNQQGKLSRELSDSIDWSDAHKSHVPNIIKCLSEIQQQRKPPRRVTIAHYLKELRDWVTYGDAYLFIRLYGESPRKKLDFALRALGFTYCMQTEF